MKVTELKVMVETTPDEILKYFYEQLAKEHKLNITDVDYNAANGKVVLYGMRDNNPSTFPVHRSPIRVVPSHSPHGRVPTERSSQASLMGFGQYASETLQPGEQMPLKQFVEGFLIKYPESQQTEGSVRSALSSTYKKWGIIEKDKGVLYRLRDNEKK